MQDYREGRYNAYTLTREIRATIHEFSSSMTGDDFAKAKGILEKMERSVEKLKQTLNELEAERQSRNNKK